MAISHMDTSRLLFHFDEYKDGVTSYFTKNKTMKSPNKLLLERDISLSTIHSTLPNYTSHHLNYCLDHCTDRDLMKYIKWKADSNIHMFKAWMRIIASTIIPQIEQEGIMINEWYYHLLHINRDRNSTANPFHSDDPNHSDHKDNALNRDDSASEEEEHYSISTELDMTPTTHPPINNKKYVTVDSTATLDARYKYKDCVPVQSDKTDASPPANHTIEIGIADKKQMTLSNLLDLPSSWLLHLFSHYFSFATLLTKLPLVCHQFRTLCGDPNVWKSIKFSITVIRNIYNNDSHSKDHPIAPPLIPNITAPLNPTILPQPPPTNTNANNANNNNNNNNNTTTTHGVVPLNINAPNTALSVYVNFAMNYNTAYFIAFLIRSCRLLQIITFEGSIEENDWNAWNHTMKILGHHALRQIKWNSDHKHIENITNIAQYFKLKEKVSPHAAPNMTVIDTLFVRCRHISRRGYCWLQSLAFIPTIQHIHCAALSRSDDVQQMIYHFNNLKTLNVNILGPRHPNRNFHSHHRLALKSISHLIPSSVTEFAIPVSVQEDFVRECFSRMPLLENLDFFRLTTPHQNVDIDSWACCLSSETIYHLANSCKNLKKCQLFVKCFKPKTEIWDSVKFLLSNCKGIHMLTIGMTESETLNGLHKILPPATGTAVNTLNSSSGTGNADAMDAIEYDKLSKRYFDQLKKVPFLRKRFRKFKKKTMKFPKFTIMWCLLT